MLMGHTGGMAEREHLLSDAGSTFSGEVGNDVAEELDEFCSEEILYEASFEELAANNLKYETIIWVSISLLLILAWGVGIFMLLYLPVRRYMVQSDISSRRLYVTRSEIVFKACRPSFIPFWGVTVIEKRVPLSRVIDIVIEQGCLQALHGIQTFIVESISRGKAAPVDELQVQGVDEPGVLREVIIREAAKNFLESGKGWKSFHFSGDSENLSRGGSMPDGLTSFKSPMKSWKLTGSPRNTSVDHRPIDLLLNKIEDVMRSVKRLELLIDKSQTSSDRVVEA